MSKLLYDRAIEPMSKRLPAAQRQQLAQRVDRAAYLSQAEGTQRLHTAGKCAACNALRISLQPALQTVGLCADEIQRKRAGYVLCAAVLSSRCSVAAGGRGPGTRWPGCLACVVVCAVPSGNFFSCPCHPHTYTNQAAAPIKPAVPLLRTEAAGRPRAAEGRKKRTFARREAPTHKLQVRTVLVGPSGSGASGQAMRMLA